jgi:exoribonuclease-2
VYEEDGALKVGAVLSSEAGALQIESAHGKRGKIRADKVLLEFKQPALAEFLPAAQQAAALIDIGLLWECAGPEEQLFDDLAHEFYGHSPSPLEATAMLLALWAAPTHFHKKARGHFKAATADQLKSALANAEKKKRDELRLADLAERLARFELPPEILLRMPGLLFKSDGSVEAKAVHEACLRTHLSPPRLLHKCGALKSSHEFFLQRFLLDHFPRGRGFAGAPPLDAQLELPLADVQAFSIDDSTTTEIDDAFSVTRLPDGNYRVGVHIAAPALGFTPGSPLDELARQRLSTVYLPGDKITMLPPHVVSHFSLDEGKSCPAVSLYLTVSGDGSYRVLTTDSRVERVPMAKNLRYPAIDDQLSQEALRTGQLDFPFGPELAVLYELALRLQALRGKPEQEQVDFMFYIQDDRVNIVPRHRGAPADRVVSELMIYVNCTWGKLLGDRDIRALFRVQDSGKVRLSLYPAPHVGLGVSQYLWASSPLRRYCDLVNQWQLIAHLYDEPSPYGDSEAELLATLRDFESAHGSYDEFQRNMERYWSLRWLQQEEVHTATATVLRENLVRFTRIPLWQRVPSLPELPAGTLVELALSKIDEWELTLHCEYKSQVAAALPKP